MSIGKLFLALLILWAFFPWVQGETLNVSAAISLKEALEEAAYWYEKEHPTVQIRLNLAASGILQRQIEAGAPCDLFVSAGWKQIDGLAKAGLLVVSSTRVVAANRLVLIAPKDGETPFTVQDLSKRNRISIGNPKTVPAGEYAQQALQHYQLWVTLQPKLILAENVRQVLDYVARGEVDAGLVYSTDAKTRESVKVIQILPEDCHKPIEYPAAVIAGSVQADLGREFLEYLFIPNCRDIFNRLGFHTSFTETEP